MRTRFWRYPSLSAILGMIGHDRFCKTYIFEFLSKFYVRNNHLDFWISRHKPNPLSSGTTILNSNLRDHFVNLLHLSYQLHMVQVWCLSPSSQGNTKSRVGDTLLTTSAISIHIIAWNIPTRNINSTVDLPFDRLIGKYINLFWQRSCVCIYLCMHSSSNQHQNNNMCISINLLSIEQGCFIIRVKGSDWWGESSSLRLGQSVRTKLSS